MPKTAHELATVASTLNRAFFDYPWFEYIFPNASRRLEKALPTFQYLANYANTKGCILTSDEPGSGASLWIHSSELYPGPIDMLRYGALTAVIKQGPMSVWRQMVSESQMDKVHKKVVGNPHWKLELLGVVPEKQGQGLSRLLVNPMLARADAEGAACYLDTHKEANVSIYRHFGFDVAYQWELPSSNVTHWAMVRQPR